MGPSAYCHLWTQQATICDWQVTTLTTQYDPFVLDKKKETKDRQIILSELLKLQSCDESTDVPTANIYSVLTDILANSILELLGSV